METNNTDAQAKIDLITNAINDSRRRLSPTYGNIILQIGYPIFAGNLAVLIFHNHLSERAACWIFYGALVLAFAASWRLTRFLFRKHIDSPEFSYQPLLSKIWLGMLFVIFVVLLSAFVRFPDSLHTTALSGYMTAIATAACVCSFITGTIFQRQWMLFWSGMAMIGAVALVQYTLPPDTSGHTFWVYTFDSFVALVLPGHILRYKTKKEVKPCSDR